MCIRLVYVTLTAVWVQRRISGIGKNYLGFKLITQEELDHICELFNESILNDTGYSIYNSMGEILLAHTPQRELSL